MGRREKRYHKDLHQQAYEKMQSMLEIGESRHLAKKEDRKNDTDVVRGKIYGLNTYKQYWRHTKQYISWLGKAHPECTTLKKAQKYVPEYLQYRVDQKLSASTIHTQEAALNKLFGITPDNPKRFVAPRRNKEDIKRSRVPAERDKHFSVEKNIELINFCRGCGFRRGVLENLQGKDLYSRKRVQEALEAAKTQNNKMMVEACVNALKTFPDQDYYILHYRDKNGKTRISPIVGPHKAEIVARMQATAMNEKVWGKVNSNCDVHSYRADYATYLYEQYARPIAELNYDTKIRCADGKYRSEIYVSRGVDKGKKLDRIAVRTVSIALGHGREDTAIANYIKFN